MQKRQLLMNEDIQEEGLTGDILKLVKKTFEDLANYALTYQKMGKQIDELILDSATLKFDDDDIDIDSNSPQAIKQRNSKKVKFSYENLSKTNQVYKA